MGKILKIFFLLISALLTLTGCGNFLYLSKLGWYQSRVTFQSVPIQEILEDREIDEEMKERIRFIQEVKQFGEERLGLRRTKNYSKFFEVESPVLFVVTASKKDRLQLYHWNFPVIGRVTYKSFFNHEAAQEEQRFLNQKGYDTFVQGAEAYSTLGWLRDPIFSPMLKWREAILANLILHEMTHATLYFKGQTDFNEQVATFIGNRGAILFLTEKYGPGSREVIEAIHLQQDDLLFGRWIGQACRRLSDFFEQPISREEKLRGREELFQLFKVEFKGIKDRFKTDCYKYFNKLELNNAVLLAYRRYLHQLEKLDELYDNLGKDLRRVVQFFKRIQASGDIKALVSMME